MPNRWMANVEITWDVKEGDKDTDALERLKASLEEIRGEGKPLAHYHVLRLPKRVFEFD